MSFCPRQSSIAVRVPPALPDVPLSCRVKRRTGSFRSVLMMPNRSCSKPCRELRRCLRSKPSSPREWLHSTRCVRPNRPQQTLVGVFWSDPTGSPKSCEPFYPQSWFLLNSKIFLRQNLVRGCVCTNLVRAGMCSNAETQLHAWVHAGRCKQEHL